MEGQVAAEVIAGEPAAIDYQAMPAAIFTDPEIGTVRMTRSEAADAGFDTITGEFPFRASGRALTTGDADGFVKIVANEVRGYVLGAPDRRARSVGTDRRTRSCDRTRRDRRGRRGDGPHPPDAVGSGDGGRRERAWARDPHAEPRIEGYISQL